MTVRVLVLAFVLACAPAGCRSVSNPASPPPSSPAPVATAGATRPDPDSIRWVRDSAEYVAAVRQTYLAAMQQIERALTSRAPAPWAVVLDADETVISNLTYQVERARAGLDYTTESWHLWVERREATPLPGAAAFLAEVRRRGGRIAIVTNRLVSECDDTRAVFERDRLAFDVMLCRPDGTPSDKNARFQAVLAGTTPMGGPPVEVLAYLGDNIQDFPGLSQSAAKQDERAYAAFGVRYFVMPNPMYGSWR